MSVDHDVIKVYIPYEGFGAGFSTGGFGMTGVKMGVVLVDDDDDDDVVVVVVLVDVLTLGTIVFLLMI